MVNMKIKKFSETAIIPTRGSDFSAGYDLYADIIDGVVIRPHETVMIPTGIGLNIPHDFFGAIYARSGLATKQGLRPANCVGVVDEDYTGQIFVPLHNDTDEEKIIYKGTRIAQIIFQPYFAFGFEEVDELDKTDRGDGGFGSTGK